ncbi:MAG: RHS repeat protein, partial [Desulfobacterales bacterium]|nr:RHS repeat protein [Desulfobacterales bacterium]
MNRLTNIWQPALDGQDRGRLQYTYYNGAAPDANLKSETDQEGNTTTYQYNGRYLKTKRTNALGDDFIWEYDPSGNCIRKIDEEGGVGAFDFDKQDRLIAESRFLDGRPIVTRYTYDPAGNRTHTLDPLGRTTETRFDQWNRPHQVIDPDQYIITTELDAG